MEAPRLSVVIATARRPEALRRAVASIIAQTGLERRVELVVIDTDPEKSAAPVVRAVGTSGLVDVVYAAVPQPGLANARNVGVARSRGDFIAFLDDDQSAALTWLARAIATQVRYDADVVFGPVTACIPADVHHRRYLQGAFSRRGPSVSGPIPGYFGCEASLVRRAALPSGAPFAGHGKDRGGEDRRLFAGLERRGARFVWASDAMVFAHPEAHRLSLGYTLKRAFAHGQARARESASSGLAYRAATPLRMMSGLAEAAGYGAQAGLQWIAPGSEVAFALDRAARGLGRALWFPPFKVGVSPV